MARACALPFFLAVWLAGCGAEPIRATEPVGPTPSPVSLRLQTAEGVPVPLEELYGRRVLLFCFATFDGMSQATLEPLYQLVRAHPEIYVLGVAIGPDADELVGPWTAAADPLFVTTFAPGNAIERGDTELGTVDTVPTFIALDEQGREVARRAGFATRRDLENLLLR